MTTDEIVHFRRLLFVLLVCPSIGFEAARELMLLRYPQTVVIKRVCFNVILALASLLVSDRF